MDGILNTTIEFSNVYKKYPQDVYALNNVSFKINKGDIVAIIGPSGAGKTTLLKCVNRLIEISKGEVCVNGRVINYFKKRELKELRRSIGMVFQNYNLVDTSNLLQNVLYGRLGYMPWYNSIFNQFSHQDISLAEKIIEDFELTELKNKFCDELSGGQKQRVCIARAMMQQPDIFVFDEPISSLDIRNSEKSLAYIIDYCHKYNITCLISLHQIEYAFKYANRIIALKNGSIVFDKSPNNFSQMDLQTIFDL